MPVKKKNLSDCGLLSVDEVAAHHSVHASAVHRWIQTGLLPAYVVPSGGGHVYLIALADCHAFVKPTVGRRPKVKT